MDSPTSQVLRSLTEGSARHAVALPFKESRFYADFVLFTDIADVEVAGVAEHIPGEYEAFYLDLRLFSSANYWVGMNPLPPYPPSGWNPIDLLNGDDRLRQLFANKRKMQVFRDTEDFRQGLRAKGVLNSACAIRLSSILDPQLETVIYATPKYPLGVQVTNSPQECEGIIGQLEEFWLAE